MFFFVFLLFLSTWGPLASSDDLRCCSKQQAAVLLNLKKSVGDPSSLSSWDPSSDCCSWTGVVCDYRRRAVIQLSLTSGADLTGRLPPSVARLTELTSLRVSGNSHLSGAIPRSLCRMRKLEELDLSGNNLTGRIPGCFGGAKLARVDLGRNSLSGPIPGHIMDGVTATGSSPAWLLLDSNELTGPIPRSLGDAKLTRIGLSKNRLTGDASFLFGDGKDHLEVLDLSGNELEFDMTGVEIPWRLRVLDLGRNRINGRIPERGLSGLGLLMSFNVSYNRLCGWNPSEGYLVSRFGASSFEYNKCDEQPAGF